MPTIEDYAKQPIETRLARLERTAEEIEAALGGQPAGALGRRPDAANWSATEVICHLRDTEENFKNRFDAILAADEPKFPTVDADRWAAERQYQRHEPLAALAAFRARREDTLAVLRRMQPGDFRRAGVHPSRGRMTGDDFVTLMAWHDDNHLDQLRRALQGKP